MMRQLALAILLFLCAPSVSAQDGFSDSELKQLGMAFIAAKVARQQPDSDAEDIEVFLALFADNFI